MAQILSTISFSFTPSAVFISLPKSSMHAGRRLNGSQKMQKLNALEQIDGRIETGLNASENIKLEHFGSAAQKEATP